MLGLPEARLRRDMVAASAGTLPNTPVRQGWRPSDCTQWRIWGWRVLIKSDLWRIRILIFSPFHSDASHRGLPPCDSLTASCCLFAYGPSRKENWTWERGKAKPLRAKPKICDDLLYNLGNRDVWVSSGSKIFQDRWRKCVFKCHASFLCTSHADWSFSIITFSSRSVPRPWWNTPSCWAALCRARGVWLVQSAPHSAFTEPISVLCAIVHETFLLIKINYNHYWTF